MKADPPDENMVIAWIRGDLSDTELVNNINTLLARLRAAERDRERWEERTLHQIRRFRYLDDLLFVDTSVHPPVYMIGPIPMHDCPNPKDANVRAVVDAAIDRAMGGENDAQ